MKKNKTLLGVALLIAVLVLGIGYALDTKDLQVGGDVTVATDDANFVVEFTHAEDDNATANDATIDASDAKLADFTVTSLTAVGDKAKATYTITNNSNVGINAEILEATATETSNGDYFAVTPTLKYSDDDKILEVGETATLEVLVELTKAPVDAAVTGTFTVDFTATPKAAAN